jgi:hypothetical protein
LERITEILDEQLLIRVAKDIVPDLYFLWSRLRVLCAVAPYFTDGDEILNLAVESCQSLEDERLRADVLVTLAPHLQANN